MNNFLDSSWEKLEDVFANLGLLKDSLRLTALFVYPSIPRQRHCCP